MLALHRKAFACFRQSWLLLLGVSALVAALTLWLPELRGNAGIAAALLFLSYYFHRHFLFGEAVGLAAAPVAAGAPPRRPARFVLVALAITLAPQLVAAAALLRLMPAGLPPAAAFWAAVLVGLAVALGTLGLFGTAMPAAVARDPRWRPGAGLPLAALVMCRLLTGPGLALLALAAGVTGLALAGAPVTGNPHPAQGFLLGLLVTFLGFYPSVLTVAILCEAYRRIVPAPAGPRAEAG